MHFIIKIDHPSFRLEILPHRLALVVHCVFGGVRTLC
jgi:hypothetical protein